MYQLWAVIIIKFNTGTAGVTMCAYLSSWSPVWRCWAWPLAVALSLLTSSGSNWTRLRCAWLRWDPPGSEGPVHSVSAGCVWVGAECAWRRQGCACGHTGSWERDGLQPWHNIPHTPTESWGERRDLLWLACWVLAEKNPSKSHQQVGKWACFGLGRAFGTCCPWLQIKRALLWRLYFLSVMRLCKDTAEGTIQPLEIASLYQIEFLFLQKMSINETRYAGNTEF